MRDARSAAARSPANRTDTVLGPLRTAASDSNGGVCD